MRIAWIGLGNIGAPMAGNMLALADPFVVHDLNRESAAGPLSAGARWADTPCDAASGADVIFTSLPGPKEVEKVVLGEEGILAGARTGATYIDLSTSSPDLIRKIHSIGAAAGIAVLDAPVSGGSSGAQRGSLEIMVGGDEQAVEQMRPLLGVLGERILHVGPIGAGTIVKLVHNALTLTAQSVVAETFTLGVKAGVSAERLLEAVQGASYGRGQFLRQTLPDRIMEGKFDGSFALQLAHKDVVLALNLAQEYDVPMPMVSDAEKVMHEALQRGWGGRDATVPFLLQEEAAGVQVRVAGDAAQGDLRGEPACHP